MAANSHSSTREGHERQSRLGLARSLVIRAILLSFVLASCRPAQSSDPISVVQTAYDRLNKGDVDGFMEFVSDDMVIVDPHGRWAGREAIREFSRSVYVAGGHRVEMSDLSRDGNIVSYAYVVYEHNTLVGSGTGLNVVVAGRIVFEGTESSLRSECERDPSQAFCPER